jgi:hypothetical protein
MEEEFWCMVNRNGCSIASIAIISRTTRKKCERGEDSSLAYLECLTCKRSNSFASFSELEKDFLIKSN